MEGIGPVGHDRDEPLAIGAHRDQSVDFGQWVHLAVQRQPLPARVPIPDPHHLGLISRDEQRAIRGVEHLVNAVRMTWQRADQLTVSRVPDPDQPVSSGAGQAAAVGAEGQREDVVGVAAQVVDEPAGGRIPDLQFAGRPRSIPRGSPRPPAVTSRRPSGLKARLMINHRETRSRWRIRPVDVSYRPTKASSGFTSPSGPILASPTATARARPSGLRAMTPRSPVFPPYARYDPAAREVPPGEHAVGGRGDDVEAVGVKKQPGSLSIAPGRCRKQPIAGLGRPDPESPAGPAGHKPSVRARRDRPDLARQAGQRTVREPLLRRRVPDPDGAVETRRDQPMAGRIEGERGDPVGVSGQADGRSPG